MPNVLRPRDLVSRPEYMDKTVLHPKGALLKSRSIVWCFKFLFNLFNRGYQTVKTLVRCCIMGYLNCLHMSQKWEAGLIKVQESKEKSKDWSSNLHIHVQMTALIYMI